MEKENKDKIEQEKLPEESEEKTEKKEEPKEENTICKAMGA